MDILAGGFHDGLKAALPYWMWAAVLGVLAAIVYYGGKYLEKKYPHLKRKKKQRRGK